MPRIQLGPVDTYYEEAGGGEPLVLLHPGGADVRAFERNLPVLGERFHVLAPDRRGHGRTPDVDGPLHYATMADDTIAFLEAVVGRTRPSRRPQRRHAGRAAGGARAP